MSQSRCPCLSGSSYGECCGPLHAGTTRAPTAQALMRSRYSAYAAGDANYLMTSWHPHTRPAHIELDSDVRWYRLDVLATTAGGLFDSDGVVEFRAHYKSPHGPGEQHEVSHFVRHDGEWVYVNAV